MNEEEENDDHVYDLIETIFEVMDDIITESNNTLLELNGKQLIQDEVFENMVELMDELYDDEENVLFLISQIFELYCICLIETPKIEINMHDHIQYLKNVYQPEQRTQEWINFRHMMITASNAHKALGSQASINSLICEKCQPIQIESSNTMVNITSPLHWGQKYEPISIELYENKYGTKIDALGCLRHPKYSFLGASPDGINVDSESPLFGRMLEIKNVVSREINGIPKREYWIQMQLQMEVCDLDYCDFLETKFIEYETESEYLQDDTATCKGYYLFFLTDQLVPKYIYKPVNMIDKEEIQKWDQEMMTKYESPPYNYQWMKRNYWKLDVLSCILVQRNRLWFAQNIQQLETVWNIILKEREDGSYVNRLPVKRVKTDKISIEQQPLLLTVKF